MKPVICIDLLGMWGKEGTDPGMYSITDDYRSRGFNVLGSPYADFQFQQAYNDLARTPFTPGELLVLTGASLGANNGPQFAAYLKKIKFDLLVGFQPSEYGIHVPVPANVKLAICIWNPTWFLTLGLGNYEWTLARDNDAEISVSKDNGLTWTITRKGTNGNILRIMENSDLHPGDFNLTVRAYVDRMIENLRGQ